MEVYMSKIRAFAIICFTLAAASLAAGLFALAERDHATLAAAASGVVVFGAFGVALGRRE